MIERQEQEATKKRKILNQSGERIADLDFTASSSTSTSENEENSELKVLDEPRVRGERSGTDTASLVSSMTTMDARTQPQTNQLLRKQPPKIKKMLCLAYQLLQSLPENSKNVTSFGHLLSLLGRNVHYLLKVVAQFFLSVALMLIMLLPNVHT